MAEVKFTIVSSLARVPIKLVGRWEDVKGSNVCPYVSERTRSNSGRQYASPNKRTKHTENILSSLYINTLPRSED